MELNENIKQFIKECTSCKDVSISKVIQDLWSGYGSFVKLSIRDGVVDTAILKHVDLNSAPNHPRGWGNNNSHLRKVKSYEIERNWYENYAETCNQFARVPRYLGMKSALNDHLLLIEDLDEAGFSARKTTLTIQEVKVCLTWLAQFHGGFMLSSANGLWPIGSYWHLSTRPDEFAAMNHGFLKTYANEIDKKLNNSKYQTIIHGDAKVANFCFSEDGKSVAAVDFQYVGKGCGMKDVAYLLSSCLSEKECFNYEEELLDHYFEELKENTSDMDNFEELEKEWRGLYAYAWADFIRFLEGWMPTHHKINSYAVSKIAEMKLV